MAFAAAQKDARDAAVTRVLFGILLANAAVAAAKVLYGTLSGSLAIRADGFHSSLDGLNNVVALVVANLAARPPDAGHPYGHRKFEVLGSLAIGVMILLLVVRVLGDAVERIAWPRSLELGPEAYAVTVATLVVNVAVVTIEGRAARVHDSPLLAADARHTLSDVFVTLAVLAGVAGARAGFARADAMAALAVLPPATWAAWGILRRGVAVLADEAALDPAAIARVARSVPGVLDARRVRSRNMGGGSWIDLVIEVDGALALTQAHAIADQVERAIRGAWPGAEVIVHVEPSA